MWTVPRQWPGETVCILGCGPSLTLEQIAFIRTKRVRIIAINRAYKICPDADILYGADFKWWRMDYDGSFKGMKIGLNHDDNTLVGVHYVHTLRDKAGEEIKTGLSFDPHYVATGGNSGYQAINLAVLMGATRIILLGFDMKKEKDQPRHYWPDNEGEYPDGILKVDSNYKAFIRHFDTLPNVLNKIGVQVINCTPGSALTCFPVMKLEVAFHA